VVVVDPAVVVVVAWVVVVLVGWVVVVPGMVVVVRRAWRPINSVSPEGVAVGLVGPELKATAI
jgi:hypothetical protein